MSDKDVKPPATLRYDIPKRSDIVRLTCEPITDFTDDEKHTRRIEALRARVAFCGRQESRRSSQRRSVDQSSGLITPLKGSSESSEEDKTDLFSLVCKPTQCIFCLGDERKSYEGRMFRYARPNKMMDEVERHLDRFAPDDLIPCPHPTCNAVGLVLRGVMNSRIMLRQSTRSFCACSLSYTCVACLLSLVLSIFYMFSAWRMHSWGTSNRLLPKCVCLQAPLST